MKDTHKWSEFAKRNMNELEYLREENKLLKENLEELREREIINGKMELSAHRNPFIPGTISAFIVAFIAIYEKDYISRQIIGHSFFSRLFSWILIFLACAVAFGFCFVILDSFIMEKIDAISKVKIYREDNDYHFRNIIPFIIFIIAIVLLTVLGPQ